MKTLLKTFLFALVLTLSQEAWAKIAQVSLDLGVDQSVDSVILNLYKSEAAKPGSALALEIKRIQDEQVEDLGTLYTPSEYDMWIISSGRGGLGHFGRTYLLGVPVMWSGTGMIEEYIEYVLVYVNLTIGDEVEGERVTVTFEKMVQIAL